MINQTILQSSSAQDFMQRWSRRTFFRHALTNAQHTYDRLVPRLYPRTQTSFIPRLVLRPRLRCNWSEYEGKSWERGYTRYRQARRSSDNFPTTVRLTTFLTPWGPGGSRFTLQTGRPRYALWADGALIAGDTWRALGALLAGQACWTSWTCLSSFSRIAWSK